MSLNEYLNTPSLHKLNIQLHLNFLTQTPNSINYLIITVYSLIRAKLEVLNVAQFDSLFYLFIF